MRSNHVRLVSECGGFYLSYVSVKIELFIYLLLLFEAVLQGFAYARHVLS